MLNRNYGSRKSKKKWWRVGLILTTLAQTVNTVETITNERSYGINDTFVIDVTYA